ncbi:hypothetical protein RB195_008802 [Necator americanus]|uniref:Nuclear transcription factor Y subunit n=1 Tax=Necator americanus TaxID=51031 RepID=A0ABR1CSX9_NECAM
MESDNLLMLADIAKLDNEERPFSWDQNREKEKEALLESHEDGFDHCYLPSSDFDRLVNPTHDYYRRIGQGELDDQEHSYAIQVPSELLGGEDRLLGFDNGDTIQEPSTSYVDGIILCPHKCQWASCEVVFASLEELQAHAERHVELNKRSCEWRDCKKKNNRYAHRYLLLRHLRSHTGSTPFSCEHCGSQFATSERMRLHIRAIHIPEVKYRCELCDRFFKTTSERRHHMTRTHMMERIRCRHCGGLYAGSTVLNRHLKSLNVYTRSSVGYGVIGSLLCKFHRYLETIQQYQVEGTVPLYSPVQTGVPEMFNSGEYAVPDLGNENMITISYQEKPVVFLMVPVGETCSVDVTNQENLSPSDTLLSYASDVVNSNDVVYVNPRQYERILKRRDTRKKMMSEDQLVQKLSLNGEKRWKLRESCDFVQKEDDCFPFIPLSEANHPRNTFMNRGISMLRRENAESRVDFYHPQP